MIPSFLGRRLPFRLLQRLSGRARVLVDGRPVIVPLHDPAALSWLYWHEGWSAQIIRAVLTNRSGAFVDIGANIGQTL